MKTKKKAINRYKFKSFAQRISNININVFTLTGDQFHGIPEDEKDTFFRETLEKLGEINCSLDFIALYKELKPYVRTFNMLLYHKDKVVASLKHYLALEESYATKACLELLATLSRDLSQDFYPIFNEVFDVLIKLIRTKDAEVVENTFVCLAYIFKCTWRYMVNEIDNLFKNFKCLLSDNQEHIQSFASESFAFLIQKSSLKKKVMQNLLEAASKEPKLAVGVGCLIYQILKGVKDQFILSAKDLLMACLSVFLFPDVEKKEVLVALRMTWLSSLKHTTAEYSGILFDCIYESIENCSSVENKPLSFYYKLLNVGVTFKRGHFVGDHDRLFQILEMQFSDETLTLDDITALLTLLKSSIELSKLKINDLNLTNLFIKFLSNDNIPIDLKLDFCRTLFKWRKFEEDLKDPIIEYLCKCFLSDKFHQQKNTLFQFMIDLIYKDIKSDEPFYIYVDESALLWFPSNSQGEIEKLILGELDIALWENDVEYLWVIVNCLCYCRFPSTENVIEKVSTVALYGMNLSQELLKEDVLCTLSHCLKALFILEKSIESILKTIPWGKMMVLIRAFPSNEHVLQAFDAYSVCLGEGLKQFKEEYVSELYDLLKYNISSPNKIQSLLTLRIFRYFDDDRDEELGNEQDVLRNCLDALSTKVTLHTYQERLMILRLATHCDKMKELHQDAALRFFISNLYVNFSLMWEPLYEMIATYASCEKNELFWNVWMELLNMAADLCASPKISEPILITSNGMFSKCFTSISASKEDVRVDYKNFRCLLWNAMCKFPSAVEKKARQIVPLYQRFMREEYSIIDEMIAKKQDLSIKHDNELVKANRKSKGKGKPEFQALCAHLRVFASFKKPKKLEKEFHLHEGYLDFLTSKDNEIQTLAIDCLMTYNHQHMTPYKGNFGALMNDTRFRDELMFFTRSPDEEMEGVVKPEHFKDLMPVLIRLLYGKLQRRAGLGASGKTSSIARRNIIMQFLVNCSNEEISTFFDLILEPFNALKEVTFASSSLPITDVVPLRKQSGFLNMLSTVLTRLSKKVETYLPQLVDTLMKVLWMCAEIIKNKEQVHVSYISRVKDIRRLGLVQLNDLFERKDETFHYKECVSDIFIVSVWPQLSNIAVDSSQSATPLLKMFVTWSKHKEYHFLLAMKNEDGLTPVDCLFNLMKQKSLTGIVEGLVMTIVLNILTVGGNAGVDAEEKDPHEMIKPFINDILDHISSKIISKTKDTKKKQMMKKVIPNLQFSVLSELSKLVSDTEQSSTIVSILFPLLQCIGSEATQFHITITINNLLPYIKCTDHYLPILPALFSMVQTRRPRQLLCEIYVQMTKENDDLKQIGELVHDLNSWDEKHLDEPDYDKRLDAFRSVHEGIKSDQWSSKQLLPVLHNVLFFLLTTEDLSLRNAASSAVENMIVTVQKRRDELFTDIIVKTLVPVVKSGLKTRREEVRLEFISLLGMMVKTFPDYHQFTDMFLLCSDDPETDFFKNFNHIQVHRKIRAIHQLGVLCDEGKLSANNLFFIILPMITPFIFTKLATTKDHNLLSETISAVGSVMNQLPWGKYSHVLKNYLKILQKDLRNQKNILRLLMAVLNNFHFDLLLLDNEIPLPKSNKTKAGIQGNKKVMEPEKGEEKMKVSTDANAENAENDEDAKTENNRCTEVTEKMTENAESEPKVMKAKKNDRIFKKLTKGKRTDKNLKVSLLDVIADEIITDDDKQNKEEEDVDDDEEEEGEEKDDEGYNSEKEDVENDEEEVQEDITEEKEDEADQTEEADDEESDVEEEEEEVSEETDEPKEETSNVTSIETLKRIYSTLTHEIIPKLNRFLQKKNPYDSSKSNYKEIDDQDMLKLPMELALAQLLHKLPCGILHLNLPGVLLRVSQSLRSHSKDVREMARDTLKKICYSLGASYLQLALKEMKSILQHGYQRHVLGYTVHSVVDNMKGIMKPGDLDICVQGIMEVVVEELVGIVAEEKEVSAITNKLFEAQHRKSNATSELVAKFVSNEYIGKVVAPLKEILDSSQTHTVIHKIEESLFHIANGLQSNKGLLDADILIFIHGVLTDAMKISAEIKTEEQATRTDKEREDYHLVAPKPARGGVTPRASDKTNNHVLITFGLHLLNSCLKRQRFAVSDNDHIKMLDPIIPPIMSNVTSKHNKIVTLSLKCICALLKFKLPSTKSYYSSLGRNLFKIMKTFTQAGAIRGKEVDLIANSFKAMTILLREHSDFSVTDKQLKILLSLVEEDIHSSSRQVVALPLFKAILSRKVKVNLINDIVKKISDLSVRDMDHSVQLQSRKIVLQFLLDYPLGKKIVDHFDFYISHLSYEEEGGRVSSLEMLTMIFNNLPTRLLKAYAGYIFLPLVMMMVNDDSAQCRKFCGCTIKVLIQMLDVNTRDEMYEIVKTLHINDNIALKHVSIQLVGLFAEVEKKTFTRHMSTSLPVFIDMLKDEQNDDKLQYNVINCLVKIFNEIGLTNDTYFNQLGLASDICKNHLLHPHAWIRLAVSQLLSLYFSLFTPEGWIKKASALDETVLKMDPRSVKDLFFSFLSQLRDDNLSKEIGDQATKNLVFLFRVVKLLDPSTKEKKENEEEEVDEDKEEEVDEEEEEEEVGEKKSDQKQWKPLKIKLFIRKTTQLASYEAANNPKETKKRLCVLRLLASFSLCLGEEHLKVYLPDILPPIHREISSSENEGSPSFTLSQEVIELIQGIVKKDVFAEAYAKMQKHRSDRRETKKRKLLTEAITNPALLARRKLKKNMAKRDQRKRKLNEKKPDRKFKKMRSSNKDEN